MPIASPLVLVKSIKDDEGTKPIFYIVFISLKVLITRCPKGEGLSSFHSYLPRLTS